jgi:hypothetical protein
MGVAIKSPFPKQKAQKAQKAAAAPFVQVANCRDARARALRTTMIACLTTRDDPCCPCTRARMSNPCLRSPGSVTWMGHGFSFVVTSSQSRDVDEIFAVVLTDAFQITVVIIAATIAAASTSSPPHLVSSPQPPSPCSRRLVATSHQSLPLPRLSLAEAGFCSPALASFRRLPLPPSSRHYLVAAAVSSPLAAITPLQPRPNATRADARCSKG